MTSDIEESVTLASESKKPAREPEAGDDPATTEKPRDRCDTEDGPSLTKVSNRPPIPDTNPPLPDEPISKDSAAPELPKGAPPLPDEAQPEDDGWEPIWDQASQAYYFYNRFTKHTQWENPRVPEVTATETLGAYGREADAKGSLTAPDTSPPPPRRLHGGYNPAIHGDYDPNADYAKESAADEEAAEREQELASAATADIAAQYVATGSFNRFTGRWQNTDVMNPEHFNDDNKSRRQMSAFFDVDAAANAHDGRSLKAERAGKKLSKKEVKAFREKRREKKEEKRRAWLRD